MNFKSITKQVSGFVTVVMRSWPPFPGLQQSTLDDLDESLLLLSWKKVTKELVQSQTHGLE